MGMQLPEWTRTLFLIASGDGWPEADEDQLWALARQWTALGDTVDALQTRVAEPVRAMRRTDWDGPAVAAFGMARGGLTGQQLSGMAVGSQNVAGFVHQTGVNVQYMKIIVLEELLLLAGQIAHLLAMAGPSFGGSLAAVAGLKALGEYLARAGVTWLNAAIASLAISEGLQLGVDAIGQSVQLALHTRRRWDFALTVDASIVGAVGGMLGPLVDRGLGAPLGMIKGRVGEGLSRVVTNASHEYLTSGTSGAVTGRGWTGTPWDATAGMTEGTVDALGRARRHHGAMPSGAALTMASLPAVDTVGAAPDDRSMTGPAEAPGRPDGPPTGEDHAGRRAAPLAATPAGSSGADHPGGRREPDPPVRRLRIDAAQTETGLAHTVSTSGPQTHRVEVFEVNPDGQVHRVDTTPVAPDAAPLSTVAAGESSRTASASDLAQRREEVMSKLEAANLAGVQGFGVFLDPGAGRVMVHLAAAGDPAVLRGQVEGVIGADVTLTIINATLGPQPAPMVTAPAPGTAAVPGAPVRRLRPEQTLQEQTRQGQVQRDATGSETPGPAGPSNSDAGSANSPDLDALWGDLAEPTKVHDRERDDQGDIRLNPLWYRLSDLPPGVVLSHRGGKWRYVVRADGAIYIGAEKFESMLSDDEWENLVGNMRLAEANRDLTVDELKAALRRQGHPTIAAGFTDTGTAVAAPARVGGGLHWNPDMERWEVNDKSGRYMSTTARPGITEERALPWITNVAARLTEHLGVEIAPVPYRTPDAAAPPVGPQSATVPAAGAIA